MTAHGSKATRSFTLSNALQRQYKRAHDRDKGITKWRRIRYLTGPIGRIVFPYTSLSTCASAVYMAENPQKIPS